MVGIDTNRVKLTATPDSDSHVDSRRPLLRYWEVVITPSDFVTIGLLVALEGLLSADNAMVLAVLVLGLPKDEQRKALRYGIVGAFAFRSSPRCWRSTSSACSG